MAEPWLLASPSTLAAVMSAGRVCPGQAGAAGAPEPCQCCWDVPGDTRPNSHIDSVPQGSGGHCTSQGVGQVISMTTSQHHGGGSMLLWQPGESQGPQPWLLAFHVALGIPLMPIRHALWKLWAEPGHSNSHRNWGGDSPGCW